MNNITLNDEVLDYLADIDRPFTMKNLFDAAGLKKTKKNEKEIRQLIIAVGQLVPDKKRLYPKISFLKDIPFRVQPTEYEIEKGIFIPGHRMLPFYPVGFSPDEISLSYNGTPLKTKTISLKMDELLIYFNLMDMDTFPILNISDIVEEGSDLRINVCNMKTFYETHHFQSGDTLIVKSLDFKKGIFSIEYDSLDNYRTHIFEIERMDKAFTATLKEVMKKDIPFPNVERQLLYTYFYLQQNPGHPRPWTIPGTALDPLLGKYEEIKFSPMPDGRTVFHFSDQSVEDLVSFPDFEDALERSGEEECDLGTIDGILRYVHNTNGLIIVRALLFDRVADKKSFDYTAIEDYLFNGLEEPYMPWELRKVFKELVREEYKKIKAAFDLKYAYLPITTARKTIIDQALEISRFLRSLDKEIVRLDELPKNEIMNLMELNRSLEETLMQLEILQLEGEEVGAEIHGMLKIVAKVSEGLPNFFAVIRDKMGL